MGAYRITPMGQVKVYFGKCIRLFINEKQWKSFFSTAIIMLIISMVTSKQMFVDYAPTKTGAFTVVCACIWVGLFNSIQSICRERAIIKREYRTGLLISSYIYAHVLYEALLCAIEAAIITLLVIFKNSSHLPPDGLLFGVFIDFYLTFFLVTFSSDMIAVMISSMVKKETTAMTIMPFVLIIQLVMSGGVGFKLTGIAEMISYLTVSKWGLNAILAISNTDWNVYGQFQYAGESGACTDPEAGSLLGVWFLLLAFCAGYIFLSILLLKRVDKDER